MDVALEEIYTRILRLHRHTRDGCNMCSFPNDLLEISRLLIRILLLPLYVLLWLAPGFRPCRQWSFNQAIRVYIA